MANNDMEEIIHKISSHLYESIKLWQKKVYKLILQFTELIKVIKSIYIN